MEIHWHNAKWVSESARDEVEARLRALAEQGGRDLIDLRITSRPSRHYGHSQHEIQITCEARGREIVVVESAEKMDQALHDALGTFRRRVRKMRARRHTS